MREVSIIFMPPLFLDGKSSYFTFMIAASDGIKRMGRSFFIVHNAKGELSHERDTVFVTRWAK